MSKRGGGHQVPPRVRQREDNRGEDVKASRSKQALGRQTARFAARAGRETMMGQAPPEQHVQELRKSAGPGKSKAAQESAASRGEPAQSQTMHRAEPPRYLLEDAKALVAHAFHLALAPLRLARSVLRGLISPKDATMA